MQELVFFIGESELVLSQEEIDGDVTIKAFKNSMDKREAGSYKISTNEMLSLIELYVKAKREVVKSKSHAI